MQVAEVLIDNGTDIISLLFVFYLFRRSRRDRAEDRKLAVEAYWFQQFALDPRRVDLLQSFREIEKLFLSVDRFSPGAEGNVEFEDTVTKYREIARPLDQFALEEVGIFDRELGECLCNIVKNLEEDLLRYLDDVGQGASPNQPRVRRIVADQRRLFFAELYSRHQALAESKKNSLLDRLLGA